MKLVYNGVSFPIEHCLTYNYDEEVISLQDGTYKNTRITIGVQCVFASGNSPETKLDLVALPASTRPAQIIRTIRERLNEPRQNLVLTDENGVAIVTSPPPGPPGTTDNERGPLPQRVSVRAFGNNAWVVDFEIVTHLVRPCQDGSGPIVIRNFWDVQVSYDQDWNARHTVSGQLMFGGEDDLSHIDEMAWATPPLLAGFIREGWNYAISRDGRTLNYTFTDRQVYLAPPTPATSAAGKYREVGKEAQTYAELDLSLSADVNTARSSLIIVAVRILASYMEGTALPTELTTGRSLGMILQVDLFSNQIDLKARWLKKPPSAADDKQKLMTPLGLSGFETIRYLTSTTGPDPGTFANFILETTHSKLKPSICVDDTEAAVPAGVVTSYDPKDPASDTLYNSAGVLEADSLVRATSQASTDHLDDPYTDYRVEQKYVLNEHKYAFAPASGETGADVQFIQASSGVWMRVVRWDAERLNADPDIPAPTPDDPAKEQLVKCTTRTHAPQLTIDGFGELRRVSGTYVYLEKGTPDLVAGKLPTTTRQSHYTIAGSQFVNGIIHG